MPAMAPITVMPISPRISDATANRLTLPGARAARDPPGARCARPAGRATWARALLGERVLRRHGSSGLYGACGPVTPGV